jgi:putative ABC transport system permease protein
MSMKKSAIIAEAWISMGATRMRSFLTMLGIIIGVASVVLMLSIGQGVQNKIKESISSMGSNLFIVLSGTTTSGGIRMGSGSTPTLKISDATEIATLPGVSGVAPVMPGTAQVVYNENNWSTAINGVTIDYLTVREWPVASGNNFTENDMRAAGRVALLGATVVQNLFPDGSDPIGKVIRIKNIPFEVIGVLQNKGQSLEGRDQDDTILMPLSTAQRKVIGSQFPDSVRLIMVKATSAEVMETLEYSMKQLLRERHHIQKEGEEDFTIRNLTSVAKSAETTGRSMSLLLGSVASISLLVGGIGIMNIMLVSVTERTREIGIRKAIGSYERDILLQFLLEAIIISVAGGIIGMLLGAFGSLIATWLLGIDTQVSIVSIVISVLVAATVGIFFGYYPAKKAAKLKPIEALRYQ